MRLYSLLFLLLFLGCTLNSNKVEPENGKGAENIDGFTFVDYTLNDSILFNECHVVALETNDGSFIREISRIYKTNDYIFILDKSLDKICIFDTQGNYLYKIEDIGNGPREYLSLMDFCLDAEKEEILLLCDRPYKIMRFKYNGQFVNEIRNDGLFMNIAMNDGYIYCNRFESSKSDLNKYEIWCMSRDGEQLGNLLEKRDNIANKLYHTGNSLSRSKHLYYTRRFDNRVYQVTKEELTEKYTMDFGRFNVPGHLSKEQDLKKFRSECKEKKYIYSITEFIENEKYIIFNTNQAICIYDKNKETFIGYPGIQNTQFDIGTNSFYSNSRDENSIVMKIEPAILYMFKENVKGEEILTLIDRIKEDDNPILLFYQFKI
ncbi:6-bladed beta-propeller [uncultured Proteiniphilum sp.]|uniref:6-bladed beta-propeller n=1 Tax=uncultured Proteiniphilum sp. TaxID=497637 RepID=UPI0026208597|nr:6-bladed beta-propeller [uncultured Proteiniphilum sp.]